MQNERREYIEKIVGIDFYGSSQKGIEGTYKSKYQDFIVKEITREGKILEIKEDIQNPYFNSRDKYTLFNVTKVKKDTIEVARILANNLQIPLNHISYSGLKDHRAITVQQMTIKGNVINKLKKIKIRNLFIRAIRSRKHNLMLGDNWGNNFSIILRNLTDDGNLRENIEQIKNRIENFGVPNFYGIQRFGIYRPNTHMIGKFILLRKYKEAVEEFLTRIFTSTDTVNVDPRMDYSDILEALKSLDEVPRYFNYEQILLDYLKDHDRDFKGSLLQLPKDLASLLISAYQSYLFNKALSERIRQGYTINKPEIGDLIGILDEEMGHLTKIKYVYDDILKKHLDKAIKLKRAVIIAPIVGYETDLDPSHFMSSIYEKIMREEGITKDVFKFDDFFDIDYPGTYRGISIKPRGFQLVKIEDDELNPGKKSARIEFDLLRGTYATIVIREFLKQ